METLKWHFERPPVFGLPRSLARGSLIKSLTDSLEPWFYFKNLDFVVKLAELCQYFPTQVKQILGSKWKTEESMKDRQVVTRVAGFITEVGKVGEWFVKYNDLQMSGAHEGSNLRYHWK